MDFNLLTSTLSSFVTALAAGQARVQAAGSGVLRALIIIEIALAGFWIALGSASVPSMFKKLLHITFWMWFATSFPTLVKAFSDSLVHLGLMAGQQSGNMSLLLDPSRIAGQALDATAPLVAAMDDAGFHIKDAIVLGLCYLIIMACFFVIACQICLAVIEYYLVVTLATCLIPFGMSSHTKFIAEKAIGAAVAVSVKLMVLSFVMALIQPVLGHIRFSGGGDVKMNELMAMMLVSGLLACVVWRAPGLASDLLAGSPSLGAAAIVQNVGAAASFASNAVARGVGATRSAASGVVRAAIGGGGRDGGGQGGGARTAAGSSLRGGPKGGGDGASKRAAGLANSPAWAADVAASPVRQSAVRPDKQT
jgi:type IV secretion system protein TrbL